eukprot:contig_20922_g5127
MKETSPQLVRKKKTGSVSAPTGFTDETTSYPKRLTCPQPSSCPPAPSGSRRTTGPRGWPAASPSDRWGQQRSVDIA